VHVPVVPAAHPAPAPALDHPVLPHPTKRNGATGDHGFRKF
jgi:hypothetical protein